MPIIDNRNQQKLVKQVRDLAIQYCPEWKDIASIESDKQADALIQIFSRMMEIIIQRLNKVPDKNFLAFLDMVGVRLSPPHVAKAPLTFTMAVGAAQYGFIPKGTQAATDEDVVFETEKDITVILPKIVKAVSINPKDDRWTDHSPLFFEKKGEGVETLFKGKDLIPHRLYLGHSRLFGFKEPATITLSVQLKKEITLKNSSVWEVKWYYFDETLTPKQLNVETSKDSKNNTNPDVSNLLKSGSITFKAVAGISEKTLTGFEKETGQQNSWTKNWIFAELNTPILVDRDKLPEIDTINASVKISPVLSVPTILPDIAFFNNIPIDLTKDFYPFGEKPKFNDTFYIGSEEVFSKENAHLTIDVTLSDGIDVPNTTNIKLIWEFWEGKGWGKIGETTQEGLSAQFTTSKNLSELLTEVKFPEKLNDKIRYDNSKQLLIFRGVMSQKEKEALLNLLTDDSYKKAIESLFQKSQQFTDSTNAFKKSGQVNFNCPKIEAKEINGEKKYWIRVRIIGGNYGEEAKYEESPTFKGTGTIVNAGINVIGNGTAFWKELKLGDSIIAANQERVVTAITSNTALTVDSAFNPQLDIATSFYIKKTGWTYKPPTYKPPSISIFRMAYSFATTEENLEAVLTYNDFVYVDQSAANQSFMPFQLVKDKDPALYLAFDQDIGTLPVTMFFPLLGNPFITCQAVQDQNPPIVAWEYWNGKGWFALSVEDDTVNLTKKEMIQFLAPDDIAKRNSFGKEYCWIRCRLDKGEYDVPPKLSAIHTNTIWGHHMAALYNEILGYSNGMSGQVFKFSHFPVLPWQMVLVREAVLTEEERKIIISEEGNDAIAETLDEAGNIVEIWVRWHEANNFYFSGPNSRHYIIDRNKGIITFGDGERGKIPPAGKDNIKCSRYQHGGGAAGNVKAEAITKLRTTFPYIDSVTNLEAADGGFEQEDIEVVKIRGPQTIKHRNRAVTFEDFEWLVKEASPKIAKVRCLPTTNTSLQFTPGWITIIIVPESEDPKPLPYQELLSEIEDYLFARTSTFLTLYPSQVNLVGPGYIGIGVKATVKFISISEAKVIEGRVIDNLKRFFHPLHGGPEGNGWNFGRNVYISEIYEVIEKTEGVDYVEDLSLNASIQIYKLTLKEDITTTTSYPRQSIVKSIDDKVIFTVAEGILSNTDVKTLNVIGFKEGDCITLNEKNVDLVIKSVSEDILECEPIGADIITDTYPAGSIIETKNKMTRSFILNDTPAQSKTCFVKVAVFEPKDSIILSRRDGSQSTEHLEIEDVGNKSDTIYIEDNYLVYSGIHLINKEKIEELVFPYLVNTNTKEVHDIYNEKPNCQLPEIKKEHRLFLEILNKTFLENKGIDYCHWCFGPELSEA